MSDQRFGPLGLPGWAWRRAETRDALARRDAAALLRLVQQFGGISQTRLASAIGTGQGRLNEIINGRRQVSSLDVFERIADGCQMPDDARMHLGLAPAHAAARGVLTGHAEIAHVFADQAEANVELRDQAATATDIRVLAVRALGLIALNDSLLRGPLTNRESHVRLRVLLLHPDSKAAAMRAGETGESVDSFSAGIRLALARLAELRSDPLIDIQVAVYDTSPTWRMLAFDGTLYLSAFAPTSEGHRSGMYKLIAAADGVLHAGFLRQFDDTWHRAGPWK